MATVSIGIPVYNGARFLAESLESVVGQTYQDIEFLISDNGSTDATEEICRSFAERDQRVAYHRQPSNRGASWNYNHVFHETTGDLFKWATHDDLLAPTYIERCVEGFERGGPDVVLVHPRAKIIDAEGAVVRDDPGLDIRQPQPHARIDFLVRNLVLSNAAFGLMRRSTLDQTRLLDNFPSSDYVMLAEFALHGKIVELPEFLFFRREHAEMSRAANASPGEVAEWFEPGSGEGVKHEMWKVFVEHLRSIRDAPLPAGERRACYAAFTRAWFRRQGPRTIAELVGVRYDGGWNVFRELR
jgi:glycosyltransferase involved in cell wall biosynthesis